MNRQEEHPIEAEKNSLIKETIRDYKNKKLNVKIFSSKKLNYKTIWSSEEDRLLLNLVQSVNVRDWTRISSNFKNKSPIQCSARYKRINPINKKGKWSQEEDTQLLKLIGHYGKNWSKITKHFKSRTGKQVRDRYVNVLDPNIIKNKFDDREDEKIIEFYKKLGTNWAEISKHLVKRTPDMIKNRFYQYLKPKFNLVPFTNKNENQKGRKSIEINSGRDHSNHIINDLETYSSNKNKDTCNKKESQKEINLETDIEINLNNKYESFPKQINEPINDEDCDFNNIINKNFPKILSNDFENSKEELKKISPTEINKIYSNHKILDLCCFPENTAKVFQSLLKTPNHNLNDVIKSLNNKINFFFFQSVDGSNDIYINIKSFFSKFTNYLEASQKINQKMMDYFKNVYVNLANEIILGKH